MAHTNKPGKAKCLAYRNSKRCGRVAVFEVQLTKGGHLTMCAECANHAVETGARIMQESPRGFTVHNTDDFSGSGDREYWILV